MTENKRKRTNNRHRRGMGSGGRTSNTQHRIVTRGQSDTNGGSHHQGPKRAKLKMISLGGTGRMNKNCMVFEYDDPLLPNGGDIIVVDAGMGFPEEDMHGVDYIIADFTYLRDNKDKIRGVLITHGHEDHIGALPHLIQEFDLPIYSTRFTAGFIERKFSEYPALQNKKVNVFDADETLRLGVFRIEPFRLAHSVPETVGFGFHTPYGLIMYALEFRIDEDPVDGWTTDFDKITAMVEKAGGALALCSDSVNVVQQGHSLPSRRIDEAFVDAFGQANGRIVIAAFASQMSRVQQVIWAAEKYGRKVAITGRSMENNIGVAMKLNYLRFKEDTIINIRDIGKYRDDQIVVITTGSQGQQYSGLMRMSIGSHALIDLKKSDMVILSSSPIPGSGEGVYRMMDDLLRLGPRVIHNKNMTVHVTGHGFRDEIEFMLRTVKPKYYIPINGDFNMIISNKEMALDNSFPEDKIIIFEDGQIVEITENGIENTNKKVPVGSVLVDGNGVGEIGNIVIRDRQAMADEGMFVLIVTYDKKKRQLLTSPDIISRGFVYMKDAEDLIKGARQEIKNIFVRHSKQQELDAKELKEDLKEKISDYLYKNTKRNPMVIPVVIEL